MSSYILGLREIVGNRCLIQCGASIIVMNEQNQVLLQKRSDNHCWGYHGGSVEIDEVVEESAKRELYEETGLIADSLTLLGIFSGPDMHYVYPNGDEVSNIDHVYLCTHYHGTIKRQQDEVDELRWFDIHQLPQNISMPNRKALNQLTNMFENNPKGH